MTARARAPVVQLRQLRRLTLDDLAGARLPAAFFAEDSVTVARTLIGCVLVHRDRAGVVVETEAYLGPADLASHARFGPTARTSVMFGPGGVSYVYLCYGVHQMFNIVTGGEGEGQAVLIRAIAPYLGLPDDSAVGRGPGKVTQALALDRRHDRRDLARGDLFVAAPVAAPRIARGPRIGVAYAGAWADRPLRFWWRDHPAVSRTPPRRR
ncbi:MAG: DNA-3-methyladenine glycosylase [Deltaproteobacteria bacterium]|nr:MAG: DNA-3-methyladenine glycosylase [Deltaproteobacteria bacterium]TMQ14855.1 MAG: DNA-3-methyladenine glycosylase [Deltaproteobacteria bacterium]